MNFGHNIRQLRREQERSSRKEGILNAARHVFSEKGFYDATVEEIADRCGLAKGTIYLYFRSKEEIYTALIVKGLVLLRKELESVKGKGLGSEEALREMLNGYFGFYRINREYFNLMFLGGQPEMRGKVPAELLSEWIVEGRNCLLIVSEIIKNGINDGVFRDVNPWAAANIIWATVNGIILNYDRDPIYSDEIAGLGLVELLNQSLDLVFGGLKRK